MAVAGAGSYWPGVPADLFSSPSANKAKNVLYMEVEGVGKQSLLIGHGGWMLPDAARRDVSKDQDG